MKVRVGEDEEREGGWEEEGEMGKEGGRGDGEGGRKWRWGRREEGEGMGKEGERRDEERGRKGRWEGKGRGWV